ncbi:MAG: valyl-tRNA synthetase [Actinomycetota bacterium]|nr:valyl-tRNA synthetase [Actinomycetota bacterium]
MPKQADDVKEIEKRWRAFWEEQGTYRYDPNRGRDETFVVDTPPPTASGALHIGHVCSYTHTDLVVRYKRMRGFNIFYPMGWDDNGLPTERRVQNVFSVRCDPSLPYDPDLKLEFGREGDVLPISRSNFIELCDVVVTEDEKQFKDMFQRVALSVDWTHTYATIDRRSRYVSQWSFLKLIHKGEAVLREAPTMWDVDFQTAVAQAEVEDRDREGTYHRIRFSVEDTDDGVVIATTRPELLPACIAVVAHPDDSRYRELIGKTAITPLFGAPVPIMADESADPEKGTGILMVCTFGDAADVEKWREMGVPAREVIGRNGRILPAAWGSDHWETIDGEMARRHHDKITGLSVNQARKLIVELLAEAGALADDPDSSPEKVVRPVKFFEKGDRPLEFVVSRQWFIKVMDKKRELIEQGRKIQWHPEMFRKRYEDWVEGLNQDWGASRQRYFGVPIPVWYAIDGDGNVDHDTLLLPQKDDLPVDPSEQPPPGYEESQRGQPGGFAGDPDVFDTWATSSLTPVIPTGWPDDEKTFRNLYPNDLRPQAHEIIRTWAFTTITRSYLEDGSVPWHHAAISGFVLDPDRKKMSKSKGNAVLPTDVLDEYGSDAVRYWAGSARLGVDPAIDHNVYREGKRLITKIRNAARFVNGFGSVEGAPTNPLDRALIGRLQQTVDKVTTHWESWDHTAALETAESWFWSDFCDNYLELAKTRAYAGEASAISTLGRGLDAIVRMFAPFLPYVTEEVWHSIDPEASSVHLAPWPSAQEFSDGLDDGSFDVAVEVMTHIRKAKSEAKVSLKVPVEQLTVSGDKRRLDLLESVMDDIVTTANVRNRELTPTGSDDGLVVGVVLGEAEKKQ